jgi:predicted small lipoprotein YifL
MKSTFKALLALSLCLGGCGKKEPVQPSATNPEATKPEKGTGKEATQPTKPEPKVDPTKHERFFWEFETGGAVSSSAIGSDGTVYVGSYDNKLYAIKTDSKGPAKSPWPMRGQNARHTGRVPK